MSPRFGELACLLPTQWEVVLSLCGDTSERHCDKGSFFGVQARVSFPFVYDESAIFIIILLARGHHFFVSVLCATLDRRFVFECHRKRYT